MNMLSAACTAAIIAAIDLDQTIAVAAAMISPTASSHSVIEANSGESLRTKTLACE